MKKILLPFLCLFLSVSWILNGYAESRTLNGVPVIDQLGISAGVALACDVDEEQLKNYEMIASRIIVNPTKTLQEENKRLHQYAEAKLKAFAEQKKRNLMSCKEVKKRFENQDIFKSVVYRDGTVKTPDGTVIKPKRSLTKGNKTKTKKK